jgi:hypothetical protein
MLFLCWIFHTIVGWILSPAEMSKIQVPDRTQWQMGIDPPSVQALFSWSINTNPQDCIMCLPHSNWYPASFCLKAIECTDQGWERMPVLCVLSVAHSSLGRFFNCYYIESFLSPTFWLGPRFSVCNFLLQIHYPKSQVALVPQGQLQVRLQLLGWLALISGPVVGSLLWFKPTVLEWQVLPRLPQYGPVGKVSQGSCSVAHCLCPVHSLYPQTVRAFPRSSHLICSCPMSIIEHIVTKCSTETSLSCHPGASIVLSSCFCDHVCHACCHVHCDWHLFLFWSSWWIWVWRVCVADVTIGLLLTCQCYDQSSLDVYLPMTLLVSCGKMTSLVLLRLYDPPKLSGNTVM